MTIQLKQAHRSIASYLSESDASFIQVFDQRIEQIYQEALGRATEPRKAGPLLRSRDLKVIKSWFEEGDDFAIEKCKTALAISLSEWDNEEDQEVAFKLFLERARKGDTKAIKSVCEGFLIFNQMWDLVREVCTIGAEEGDPYSIQQLQNLST